MSKIHFKNYNHTYFHFQTWKFKQQMKRVIVFHTKIINFSNTGNWTWKYIHIKCKRVNYLFFLRSFPFVYLSRVELQNSNNFVINNWTFISDKYLKFNIFIQWKPKVEEKKIRQILGNQILALPMSDAIFLWDCKNWTRKFLTLPT